MWYVSIIYSKCGNVSVLVFKASFPTVQTYLRNTGRVTLKKRKRKQKQPESSPKSPQSPAQSPRIFDTKEEWKAFYEEHTQTGSSGPSDSESSSSDSDVSDDETTQKRDDEEKKSRSTSASQPSSLNVSVAQKPGVCVFVICFKKSCSLCVPGLNAHSHSRNSSSSSSQLTVPPTNDRIQEWEAVLKNLVDIKIRLEKTSNYDAEFFRKNKSLTAEIRRVNGLIFDERERLYEVQKFEKLQRKVKEKKVSFYTEFIPSSHKDRVQRRKQCMKFLELFFFVQNGFRKNCDTKFVVCLLFVL